MKKPIKAIVASIFIICLNINYVTAEPLPGIQRFVGANGSSNLQVQIGVYVHVQMWY